MKARRFIYLIIAALTAFTLVSLTINKEKKFYYAFDKKTLLVPQNNTMLIKFTKGFNLFWVNSPPLAAKNNKFVHGTKQVYS